MRRLVPLALLLTALLAGCAESQLAGHLLYMTPYKFEQLDCATLKKRAETATDRVKDLERLRDKANASTAGPLVNSMAYGPDYNRARWEERLYRDEFARKNCDQPKPEEPAPAAASQGAGSRNPDAAARSQDASGGRGQQSLTVPRPAQ